MTPKPSEVQFSVMLETDIIKRLDALIEYTKSGASRRGLIVTLLETGIEAVEHLEHVGIFQLALLIRNMTGKKFKPKKRKSEESKKSEMPIPITIDEDYIDRLQRLADKTDITRQRLAQNLITTGLIELETLQRHKVLDAAMKLRDMHDLFTNFLEVGKQAFYAGKEVKPK